MVVDLDRSRSVSTYVYQDFMNCHIPTDLAGCLNTLPVPISRKDCPFKARFVFVYGVDNSDKPSYLLWPIRGVNGQFFLVEPWSGNRFDLEAAKFMEPIGLEHFFDAFALDRKQSLKVDAAAALNIPVNDVSDSLPVTALAQTLTSAAKMTLRMFLIWRNLTKRIPTSVLSLMEWTHKLWNGMAYRWICTSSGLQGPPQGLKECIVIRASIEGPVLQEYISGPTPSIEAP